MFVVWWRAVITILWVSCWVLRVGPSPVWWGCYWAWPMSSRWRSLIDSSVLWWKRRTSRTSATSYSLIQRRLLRTAVASLLTRCAEPSMNCIPSRRFVYFSLSFIGFTYFLLLSIPSFCTRIVPLRFQAGGCRRRPNLGFSSFCLCYLYSLVYMYFGVLLYFI